MGLEFLSCYLGVAASHGYFGAVAVVFSTSLVSQASLSCPYSSPFIISSTALALLLPICCVLSAAAHPPWLMMIYCLSRTLQSQIFMGALLQDIFSFSRHASISGHVCSGSCPPGMSSMEVCLRRVPCPICSIQLQFPSRLLLLMPLSNVTTLWPD